MRISTSSRWKGRTSSSEICDLSVIQIDVGFMMGEVEVRKEGSKITGMKSDEG